MKFISALKRRFRSPGAASNEEDAMAREQEPAKDGLYVSLDALGEGVVAVDVDGNIIYMNAVAEKMTGFKADEATGQPGNDVLNMVDVVHRHRLPFWNKHTARETSHWNTEAILVNREGKDRRVVQNHAPVLDAHQNEQGAVFLLRDIGGEYEFQNQLRQVQKMAAVGTLAGGVAHDFNNLLAAILGNAQLIQAGMDPDAPDATCIAGLIKSAERAADLTQKLLDFSHKGSPVVTDVEVNNLVDDVINLLEHSIAASIEVDWTSGAGEFYAKGDANQLQNVLLNLCLNACDAMPDGGTLALKTESTVIDGSFLISSGEPLPPGNYIRIVVADTGVGIPADLREEIFKPFFTTKPKGKGTGLGLASAYTCVVEHKGGILVESEVGKGSEFSVLLPAAESADDQEEPETGGEPIRGEGHILIVDDEDVVCRFGAKALESLGYQVTTASDGMEGVITFHKMADKLDLVLLDIVMPKMDGIETFKRMHELNRRIPILLCSGFSRPAALDELLEQGAAGFVAKPYSMDKLSREVHRAITQKAQAVK